MSFLPIASSSSSSLFMSITPRLAYASAPAASRSGRRYMQSSGRTIPHDATPSTPPSTGGVIPPQPLSGEALPPQPQQNIGIRPVIDKTKRRGVHLYDADSPSEPAPHGYKGIYELTPTPYTPKETPLPSHTPKGKIIPYRPPTYINSPPTLPPLSSHVVDRSNLTHPLWNFFHLPRNGAVPLGGLGMHLGDLKQASEIAKERERAVKEGKGEGKEEELRGLEEEGNGIGLGSLESLESGNRNLTSGRSWTAAELRLKSFTDLHTLWYVLLRERNVLATQREERRRMGIQFESELVTKRTFRCRKSMARIKYVLNERRLALIAATESTRPASHPAKLVAGRSPMGTADPLALSGFEVEVQNGSEIEAGLLAESMLGEADEEGLSGGKGDGERQKSGETDLEIASGGEAVVGEDMVAKAEVESRDEGFGGGKEAKDFVKDMEKAGL